jgi:hypothetical protein
MAPWSIMVLELRGDRSASLTSLLDVGALFPLFGSPERLVVA